LTKYILVCPCLNISSRKLQPRFFLFGASVASSPTSFNRVIIRSHIYSRSVHRITPWLQIAQPSRELDQNLSSSTTFTYPESLSFRCRNLRISPSSAAITTILSVIPNKSPTDFLPCGQQSQTEHLDGIGSTTSTFAWRLPPLPVALALCLARPHFTLRLRPLPQLHQRHRNREKENATKLSRNQGHF
jgi:hypothetical protein